MNGHRGHNVIRWADTEPVLWQNGGGVTRELCRSRARGEFDWRVSIAEVSASGEFSRFPGVERTIVLLDGPSMSLTVAGATRQLVPFAPWTFDGGLATSCDVSQGATRALNVMTRRGRCNALVAVIQVPKPTAWRLRPGLNRLFVVLDGQVSAAGEAFAPIELNRNDLLQLRGTRSIELSGPGRVASIEIFTQRSSPVLD